MPTLYKRLADLGFSRKFVRTIALPSWWDDDAAKKPAGYTHALMLVSRHLGIELATLRDDAAPLQLRDFGPCKFKKSRNASNEEVTLARTLATQVAQIASLGVKASIQKQIPSAQEIRQHIFDRDRPWVDLEGLLQYCWSIGIPVLHISNFPAGARKKMDGLAARIEGRPVIIVCKEKKHPAWLLFIIAHELGHIARGHIDSDGVLVDESVDESSNDSEEIEANQFAVELLSGHSSTRIVLKPGARWPDAATLAREAQRIGKRDRIDPGHIVLNYAHSMGSDTKNTFWPVANAALNILTPDADALGVIRGQMAEALDWSTIPDDCSEYIMHMTGAGADREPLT